VRRPKGKDARKYLNKTSVVGKRAKPRVPRKEAVPGETFEGMDLLTLNQDVLRNLEVDPAIYKRPGLLWFRRLMWTQMRQMNGRPVTDPKTGATIDLSMQEMLVIAATSAAINPQHPRQFEFAELLFEYLMGKRPELAPSGAGAPPTGTEPGTNETRVDQADLAKQVADTLRVLAELSDPSKRQTVEPIEVSKLPAMPKGPVVEAELVNEAVPAPTAPPTPAAAVPQVPFVGSVKIR